MRASSGNLAAVKQSDLSFDLAGEITKVYVSDGERVSEGEALARLEPTDTTEDITWLRAPFSGTIASVGVTKGDTVAGTASTDSTAAITLVQLKRYELSVSLSESDIGKVKTGQLATVTVSATGEKLAAEVVDVGLLSSSSSTDSTSAAGASSSSSSAVAYPVTLRLTQTSSSIKPGMTASADIVTSQATGLTVPTQALRGNTVTLAGGTTARVQTGVAGDSTTQIVSGLKAGDHVVITSTSAAASAGSSSSTASASATQQRTQGLQGAGGGGFPGGGTGGPPAGGAPGGAGR